MLYIDAYDSFSNNVVAMLEENLDVKVTVKMIDSKWPAQNRVGFLQQFQAIVLGPGPGSPLVPADQGIMKDIWGFESENEIVPILGICLGFQSMCLYHGCDIKRLRYPLHGQVRRIHTAGRDIFAGVSDVAVTLYHSLYASVSSELDILAWLSVDDDSIPMAVRHRSKPYWGVQFHPESCMSDVRVCVGMLKMWWNMCLDFNNKVGRKCPILPSLTMESTQSESLEDATSSMLEWSVSASGTAASRSFTTHDLTERRICEILNSPSSPAVMFRSGGRYTVISAPSPGSWRLEYYVRTAKLILEASGNGQDRVIKHSLSASGFWESLRRFMERKRVSFGSHLVPFWGGFLGFFSYEMGLACLRHMSAAVDGSEDLPDASLLWSERSVVIDHRTGLVNIQSTMKRDDQWLDQTARSLNELSKMGAEDTKQPLDKILRRSHVQLPEEEPYKRQVEACKARLEAGESYELCLTCETRVILQRPDDENDRLVFPWQLFKRLKKHNPAAYSAYGKLGNVKIVSSSPECFLQWDRESMLEMKPMKGTVKKSKGMTIAEAQKLLSSPKETAENLMIADLVRHDLYGVCGSGCIHVRKLLDVEDHGRVYQMITHIRGQIKQGTASMATHGLSALQRCLPPGSMTGAPKERSCIHLHAIEGRSRGIYSGVMGFLDLGGGGSFSVLIRTAFSSSADDERQQVYRIGAGGAVTSLSTPEGEWDEMMTKLRTVYTIFDMEPT